MLSLLYELPLWASLGLIFLGVLGVVKAYLVFTLGVCKSTNKLDGKTVIITGANTGIGKETAIDLAKRGARIILACRDLKKAASARDDIITKSGNKDIIVKELNLASFKSVRKFAADILENESRLDVLINNAGCAGLDKTLTEDGLEYQMQSNHFGHFLLTNLLLGLLIKTESSRIINVRSEAHMLCSNLNVNDLNFERESAVGSMTSPFRFYSPAKLCNILFTNELAVKLKSLGLLKSSTPSRIIHVSSMAHAFTNELELSNLNSEVHHNLHTAYHKSKLCQILCARYLAPLVLPNKVTVNALCPGAVGGTQIFDNLSLPFRFATKCLSCLFFKTTEQGAQTTIHLAVADEVANITGEYFVDCKIARPSKLARDAGLAKKLWEISETMVGLKPEERHF